MASQNISGINHFTKKVTSWYIKHILVGKTATYSIHEEVKQRFSSRPICQGKYYSTGLVNPQLPGNENMARQIQYPFCIHIFRKLTEQPTNCWKKKTGGKKCKRGNNGNP